MKKSDMPGSCKPCLKKEREVKEKDEEEHVFKELFNELAS